MKSQKYWNDEMSFIAGALVDYLPGLPNNAWAQRDAIAFYVSRCMAAGFCTTEDHVRLCADRWLAGKRKVTPPGTKRRKRAAKERAKLRAAVPAALTAAVQSVVAANEKAVSQYKTGNEKAINALVGQVMRQHKTDAALVKELLVEAIQQS